MNINKENLTVFCHICNEWISLDNGIYIIYPNVECKICQAHLGYEWDLIGILWNREDWI